MKTDKNTVIGFVLLAVLFFVYFWYTSKQQNEIAAYKKRFDDSVAMVKANAENTRTTSDLIPNTWLQIAHCEQMLERSTKHTSI